MKDLLKKIAMRLEGMHRDDLTTAERQIANLLINAGYLFFTKDGELESTSNQLQL